MRIAFWLLLSGVLFATVGCRSGCNGLLCTNGWGWKTPSARENKPLFCSMNALVTPRIACAKRRDPRKNAECRQAYERRVYNCR